MRDVDGALPDGMTVVLSRQVKLLDSGRALLGGAPTRMLYLTAYARTLIDDRRITVRDGATRALADRLLEAGMADPVLGSLPAVPADQITWVIPAYGRPQSLDRLLASIGAGAQVIVVDDCSPNGRAVEKVVLDHAARYVRLARNVGPAGARNEGLRRVSTPFAVFADSDLVVDRPAVVELLRHFADPRVAVVAPRISGLEDEQGLSWIGRYEHARSSLDMGRYPALVRPRSPVSWLPGACLVVRVDALGTGFSGDMRVGEDVDLVWRLAEAGWRIRYEPAATVWHEHRQTVSEWLGRKRFYGSSADRLASNHPLAIAPAVLHPWTVGVIVALMAQRRWSLPVAAVISLFASRRIAATLTRSEHPVLLSSQLTARGIGAALNQTMALLLRHWWPLAAVGSIGSRRVRRAVLVSGVADAVIEYRRLRPRLDFPRFLLARRLDDLAYGTGLWLGAIKGRSARALLPDFRRKT